MKSPRRPSALAALILPLAGFAWSGAVAWGFRVACRHQVAAGEPARCTGAFPAQSSFAPDPESWTLVVCAHPRCPCTRASLSELERIAARCGGRLGVRVFFYTDPALGPGWERTDLWERAEAIPGAEVAADPLGRMAARFGARTSGQVLLFRPGGKLAFEGGITSARGHEGANPGAAAVADLVMNGEASLAHAPVFGCSLGAEPGS